ALDRGDLRRLPARLEQTDLVHLGVRLQVVEGDFADPASRLVDGAQERDAVGRVDQKPKVGKNVLVLLPLEERQALDDLERYPPVDKRGLEVSRQGVHPDENGEVAVAVLAALNCLLDSLSDDVGLVEAGVEGQDADRLAVSIVGSQGLLLALSV